MNFHLHMIQWLMVCVSSPTYSIILNGCLEGYFKGEKGLRQADPISPYLFILVMEAFSCTLDKKVQHTGFIFHPKCEELKINHVIFTDDLFIMCGANISSLEIMKEEIIDFGDVSGFVLISRNAAYSLLV